MAAVSTPMVPQLQCGTSLLVVAPRCARHDSGRVFVGVAHATAADAARLAQRRLDMVRCFGTLPLIII
jgi:hypothetical protein